MMWLGYYPEYWASRTLMIFSMQPAVSVVGKCCAIQISQYAMQGSVLAYYPIGNQSKPRLAAIISQTFLCLPQSRIQAGKLSRGYVASEAPDG